VLFRSGAIAGPRGSDGILIRGIDPKLESRTSMIPQSMVWGKFDLFDSDTLLPSIILGRNLAGQIGAQPLDTVSVFMLTNKNLTIRSANPIVKRFVVSGIFETGMYDYDASLCYIHIARGQKLFGSPEAVTGIQIKTKNFYNAPKLAKKIEAALGFPYYTVPWSEMNKNLFSWMTLEKWGMFIVLALIIAVAAFNIVSTLMMVVMEKTSEIGVLKAMGATDKSLVKIFLLQGAFYGIVGTVLGTIAGAIIIVVQSHYHIISLPPDVYSISSLPMQLRALDVLAVTALSIALSILSAVYPAWRAAKLNPVEAIRRG
jgi:lipoprotein-releasing system permease protein